MSKKTSPQNSLTFHGKPFFILAILFSLGIIAEYFTNLSFSLLFIMACLLILASFLFFKKNLSFDISLLIFFLLLGMLSFKNYNTSSKSHLYYQLPAKKTHAFCLGTIIDDPKEKRSQFTGPKTSFKLGVKFLKLDKHWIKAEGKILVNAYGKKEAFSYGDKLLIEGTIQRPRPPGNPWQFDYKKFLERDKIFALFSVSKNNLVKKMGTDRLNFVEKYAFSLRHRLRSKIKSYIFWPQREILDGILLGFREEIPKDFENIFIKTGTMHLLSISGLHVGLVIVVIMFLLRMGNVPRKLRFFLILLFLLFYAPLTGLRVPVIRASIMAAVVLIGFLFERETDIVNSLGIAALIILLFCPNQIFSVGFQLSFVCLLSIIYFSPTIETALNLGAGPPARLKFYLKKSISVSLAAWIVTLPLSICYFNNFSLLTVVSNLVAIPLSFLIIIFAIIFVVFGVGFLANFWAHLTSLTIGLLLKFLGLLSFIPFGFYKASAWSAGAVIAFYLFMIFIFNYRRLRLRPFYLLSAGLLIFACMSWAPVFKKSGDIMKVNFFDVGFGDAILIEFPKGEHMLIDGGSFSRGCGRSIIAPFLWNKNIKRLEAVVLTHPESDHLGGLNFILENFEVGTVFDNGQRSESFCFAQYINTLGEKKIPHFTLHDAQSILGFEDAEITVLHPPTKRLIGTAQDLNNNSVVLEIRYKNFGLLLTGDIQDEGLRHLLGYKQRLELDVVKLPHHGLQSGTELEILLETAKPEAAIISAGREKEDKIDKTKQLLIKKNIKVYNTADNGFISIETDGINFEIKTFR